MKIVVKETGGKGIRMWLPWGLVCNRLTAPAIARRLQEKGLNLTAKQLRMLFRQLRRYKAGHPGWKLVEIESRDGETVEISL